MGEVLRFATDDNVASDADHERFGIIRLSYSSPFLSSMAAWAAANLAIGTRNGLQLT